MEGGGLGGRGIRDMGKGDEEQVISGRGRRAVLNLLDRLVVKRIHEIPPNPILKCNLDCNLCYLVPTPSTGILMSLK